MRNFTLGLFAPSPSHLPASECASRSDQDPGRLCGAGGKLGVAPGGEKGPHQTLGHFLRVRSGALSGHAADDYGASDQELEIADLAYSTLGLAIQNAGLDDLKVIADEFQDGAPGYYSDEFFVRKDSGIAKIEDLKGKVIATNATGSGIDIAMKAMLHKHGLDDKRDYTTIEAPFPAMASMLAEKKVDLVPGVLPFSLNPALRDSSNVLFTRRKASAAPR